MRTLHLTQGKFEVLYDVVEETIFQIRDGLRELNDDDLTLDDYEIYQVWQNLNKLEGKS